MPGLHHRAAGSDSARVTDCGAADISPRLNRSWGACTPPWRCLLQRLAPRHVVLVSGSALAPYGLEEGRHRWDEATLLEAAAAGVEDGTL